MKKCKIYVVAHKDFSIPIDTMYVPIQVGAQSDLFGSRGIRDNTENNIAGKNPNYCELTALYWIWKNVKNIDIVGICHYRRYFVMHHKKLLTEQDINNFLKKYDAIVPKMQTVSRSVKQFYYIQGEGRKNDIERVAQIIGKKYPDYIPSLDYVFNSSKAYYCNMMITSKKLFDDYCAWLFDILFELEKNVDLSDYTKEEARIYGYLSEILQNVWMHKNGLKLKHIEVINTEQDFKACVRKRLLTVIYKIKNLIGYGKNE